MPLSPSFDDLPAWVQIQRIQEFEELHAPAREVGADVPNSNRSSIILLGTKVTEGLRQEGIIEMILMKEREPKEDWEKVPRPKMQKPDHRPFSKSWWSRPDA